MLARLFCTAIFTMVVTGCAAPLVIPNTPKMQYRVGHAVDWQALADRTVSRFASTLHTAPPNVFVVPGPTDMPFARAFRKNLQTALMKRGYPVSETAENAVALNFDVQTYFYGAGNQKRLVEYATFWTTIGAIASPLHDISSPDTAIAASLVAGPLFDALSAINDTTPAEVTLTITVTDRDRLHYTDAENFYVKPNDLPFYWTALSDTAPQPISTTALTTVSLPIVGAARR